MPSIQEYDHLRDLVPSWQKHRKKNETTCGQYTIYGRVYSDHPGNQTHDDVFNGEYAKLQNGSVFLPSSKKRKLWLIYDY